MFDAPFPAALVELGRMFSGLSLGWEVASPTCAGLGSGYYASFGMTVLSFLLVGAGLLFKPLLAKVRNGWTWAELARSSEGARGFRDLFVVVLLVHPTISGKAMEFFRCRTIDGETYLMADYSVECYDAKWFAYLPLVLFVLVGFALGTPAAIFFVLRQRRDTLYDVDGKVNEGPLDILHGIYRPHAYYFETVQMVSWPCRPAARAPRPAVAHCTVGVRP